MINPAKPEIKAARPRTYTTLWDTIIGAGYENHYLVLAHSMKHRWRRLLELTMVTVVQA